MKEAGFGLCGSRGRTPSEQPPSQQAHRARPCHKSTIIHACFRREVWEPAIAVSLSACSQSAQSLVGFPQVEVGLKSEPRPRQRWQIYAAGTL